MHLPCPFQALAPSLLTPQQDILLRRRCVNAINWGFMKQSFLYVMMVVNTGFVNLDKAHHYHRPCPKTFISLGSSDERGIGSEKQLLRTSGIA